MPKPNEFQTKNRLKKLPFDRRVVLLTIGALICFSSQTLPSSSNLEKYLEQQTFSEPTLPFLKVDNTLRKDITSIGYANNILFKIAWTVREEYTHYYIGVFSAWMPLPYLPKTVNPNHIAFGICLTNRCICVPDSETSNCYSMEWGRSHFLAIIFGLQFLIFFLYMMENTQSFLQKHTVLNIYNLSCFRILSPFISPFAHSNFFSLLRASFMTATVIDVMIDDRIGDLWILFTIYTGSWVFWLSEIVYKKYKHRSSPSELIFLPFQGNHAGITALCSFHYFGNSNLVYEYEIPNLPFPLQLSVPYLVGVMALLDVPQKGVVAVICHGTAFLFGQYIYLFWQNYQ